MNKIRRTDMLSYLSNFLTQGNQKQIIGLSLTPGIGLEAVVLDKQKNIIVNYGRKKVEYNFSTREVEDYTQFKTALVELMDEMKISPKSFTYLVLPNVYFDFIEVPPTIGNAEIKTAILSKAEEFYLFKKDEPISGYTEVINPDGGTQRKLVYSSFQKSTIDELREIITDIGLQIIGVESAYSATLRGLFLTGLINDVIRDQSAWTVMLVNTNSYTLFQIDGKDLIDYAEVPIAIKSFSTEEAYQAIVSSSMQLLSNFSSTKLYIISQTDDISAEVLKGQLDFDREIIAIDSNRYSKAQVLETSSSVDLSIANSITLASIGAARIKTGFNLVINVLADDPSANMGVYFTTNILGEPIDVTKDVVIKLSTLLLGIIVVVFGLLYGVCDFINNKNIEEYNRLNKTNEKLKQEISQIANTEIKQEIDINAIIDEIAQMNVIANNFYDSIATDIPKNVWLTKYFNQAGDKIAIQGIAENIVDIYEYYKNLRIVSPKSDIKLTELKVITASENDTDSAINDLAINSDTDRLYSFEISNTQIDFNKNTQNQPQVNENDIIVRPQAAKGGVERTSGQMTPTK